ncbi:ComGF family competence protein [Halobacillus campisalis]|uniref:ComGF family competence protein n=1 Tax=Halobacillus campisalis TaxID=435909 RepID=A0ABW2K427_9BACI|nr:ComGF family competence protein [Halobacillus campisalis]
MTKKRYVCTHHVSDSGFTLAETIISATLITILLIFTMPLLKLLESPSYSQELSVLQFFTFIEEEINTAISVRVINENLHIVDSNQREISISKYGRDVRRRVDYQGHELLINDIDDFSVEIENNILNVSITDKNGEGYNKRVPVQTGFQ